MDSLSSPNFGPRRNGLTPRLIVIHYTAMENAEAALTRLCDPQAEVSAHYLISNHGRTLQLVADEMRAWHAGAGEWAGQADINSRSIGIELDNRGCHPFSEPQMAALETLLKRLMARWDIPAAGVLGHSDIAPGRKSDPGPHFDWARLARQGLALATPATAAQTVTESGFRAAARAAGFTADVPFETLLAATRLRHGPWRRGPLCPADLALPPL
ncbi:N-acetylmuramoyl-L-alanine amidase [Sulfitobacter porphyrae]|nr:N-acetylmuramoyl-L-alanine amidase [Sulfitobacter porphyrae]